MEWEDLNLTFTRPQANRYIDLLEEKIRMTNSEIDRLEVQLKERNEEKEELEKMIYSIFDEWLKVHFSGEEIWLAVTSYDEELFTSMPVRTKYGDWSHEKDELSRGYHLPEGYIEHLTGKRISSHDEPIKYKNSRELENVEFYENE